jgi:hypothetical protein
MLKHRPHIDHASQARADQQPGSTESSILNPQCSAFLHIMCEHWLQSRDGDCSRSFNDSMSLQWKGTLPVFKGKTTSLHAFLAWILKQQKQPCTTITPVSCWILRHFPLWPCDPLKPFGNSIACLEFWWDTAKVFHCFHALLYLYSRAEIGFTVLYCKRAFPPWYILVSYEILCFNVLWHSFHSNFNTQTFFLIYYLNFSPSEWCAPRYYHAWYGWPRQTHRTYLWNEVIM